VVDLALGDSLSREIHDLEMRRLAEEDEPEGSDSAKQAGASKPPLHSNTHRFSKHESSPSGLHDRVLGDSTPRKPSRGDSRDDMIVYLADACDELRNVYGERVYASLLACLRKSLHALKRRVCARSSDSFLFLERPFF